MKSTPYYIPMWGAAQQRVLRGGICAAFAQVRSTGLQDASVTLLRALTTVWQSRPTDESYLSDLEKLFPAPLTRAVRARLNGIEELSDPGLDADEQRKRLAAIQAIRARGMTRPCREARIAGERTIEEGTARFRHSLLQAFAAAPHRVRSLVDQVKRALKELTFPAPDAEALPRFQRTLKALEQITARRSALAASSFEFVVAQLRNMAHAAYDESLAFLAHEVSDEMLRAEVPKLLAFLDELAGRGMDFTQRMHGALTELENRQKQVAQDQHVSRASVSMALQGPDEKEILAGMIARNRCADLNQLASYLLDSYQARLRQRVPHLCPYLDANTATFADIIRSVEPSALAEEFSQLVEESVGPGHSVYEVIGQHGIDIVADFLHRRSAPTCHLGERDVEVFNVSPLSLTIVRLPPPVGPHDAELRESLKAAFSKRGDCTFTDGAASDRSVTVVRVHVGWPIAIAEENRALLDRYLRSGEHGHPPHLVNLIPDSPLGTVSPSAKKLANQHHR